MSPSAASRKRKEAGAPISPPPLKRAVKSGTTKNAVASFFTPTSQKPKDATTWTERSPNDDAPASLLVGKYQPASLETNGQPLRRKIAAFDLDSTLIITSSGKKHAGDHADWKWWDSHVPGKLRELYHEQGYQIAIFSNQGGLTLHLDANTKGPKTQAQQAQKRVSDFKQKCNSVLTNLDLPTSIYAATGRDMYRKPRTGMWQELCDDCDIPREDVNLEESFFVGDAGGRTALLGKENGKKAAAAVAKDFSCSDRDFAHNMGVKYLTPEEFFRGEEPRDFVREFDLANFPYEQDTETDNGDGGIIFEKRNDKDLVVFCGPPGAGKSTFFWTVLKPLGYERVNQDILKTRGKCIQAAQKLLDEGKSVAVDNTNPDPDTRARWIDLAKKSNVPIRCVWFSTPTAVCEHNDAVRSLNKLLNPEQRQGLPKLAFIGFGSRFKEPKVKEGFEDVTEVKFKFRGTKDEYDIWSQYWT